MELQNFRYFGGTFRIRLLAEGFQTTNGGLTVEQSSLSRARMGSIRSGTRRRLARYWSACDD